MGALQSKVFLGFFLSALVLGCGSSESTSSSGTGKEGEKPSSVEKEEKSYSDESIAFMYGRQYAFACFFTMLDKPTNAEEKMTAARTLAQALGLSEPQVPTKDGALETMRAQTIPSEIQEKKGDKVSAHFSLGISTAEGFFGALIGADTAPVVADIERHAKTSELPESLWKASVEALKEKPTQEEFEKLADALQAHFRVKK